MQDVHRLSDDIIARASRLHQLVADDMARREKTAAQSVHGDRLLIGLVFAAPLVLIAFYLLLTRWVTKPLLALHRGVLDLQAGRSARILVQVADEIGEVGQAFNDLADHLSASQEQVQQHTRQLEALYTASRALSKESSREVLYQTVTDLARSLTESRYAVLALFNDEERVIQVVESGVAPFAAGLSDQGIREMIARLPRSRRPLCIGEKGDDPRLRSLPCSPPLRTLLAVPLFAETALRGELYAMQKIRGTYTTADQDLVATIAYDASQSLKVIRLHEEAERLATIDGLTGFANRWAFEDRLAEEFMKAGRRARPFALIFSDLDRLKDINDRCGHAIGDAAIRRFCDAIRASIRTTDIVGRYGGDELLVLMPETVLDDALVVAERILRRLAGVPFTAEGQTMTLTASLGVAAYPEHARDTAGLLRAADYALYQAKTLGRSRVHTFQASTETKDTRG